MPRIRICPSGHVRIFHSGRIDSLSCLSIYEIIRYNTVFQGALRFSHIFERLGFCFIHPEEDAFAGSLYMYGAA